MKKILFKGFAIALLGILLLLVAAIFMPYSLLHNWGWIIFLSSLGLITWGLLPYKRLSRLQIDPNELILSHEDVLGYYSKGRKILAFPLDAIDKMSFIDQPQLYGIAVWLKPSAVIEIDHFKSGEKLKRLARDMADADLFFPYFNQRSFQDFQSWQEEKEEEE